MSVPLRIAAAQYPVSEPADWQAAEAQLQRWVVEAAGAGAQLLVFPEYAAMSLAALLWLASPGCLACVSATMASAPATDVYLGRP